ncbi:hypothetical protein ACQJBY_032412 [Aegilops geniculata]
MMGSQYRCTNPSCSAKEAQETYCVYVLARDDVDEAELVMFDKVGKAAVGKPLLTLLKFRNPGLVTIEEIARVPMVDRIAPPEVNQVVGQKYKLLVSISKRIFSTTSQQLSFQVVKIMETYKPQLSSSAFDCIPGKSGASSSTSLIDSPSTSRMFTPNTPNIHQVQPGSSSGSLAIGYQTPTCELSVSLLPTASPGKLPCPAGSARRALFPGLDNRAAPLEEPMKKPDETTEVHQEESDGKVEAPSVAVEEKNDKDEQNQATKNKRNPAAGKGTGTGKKSRQVNTLR